MNLSPGRAEMKMSLKWTPCHINYPLLALTLTRSLCKRRRHTGSDVTTSRHLLRTEPLAHCHIRESLCIFSWLWE